MCDNTIYTLQQSTTDSERAFKVFPWTFQTNRRNLFSGSICCHLSQNGNRLGFFYGILLFVFKHKREIPSTAGIHMMMMMLWEKRKPIRSKALEAKQRRRHRSFIHITYIHIHYIFSICWHYFSIFRVLLFSLLCHSLSQFECKFACLLRYLRSWQYKKIISKDFLFSSA